MPRIGRACPPKQMSTILQHWLQHWSNCISAHNLKSKTSLFWNEDLIHSLCSVGWHMTITHHHNRSDFQCLSDHHHGAFISHVHYIKLYSISNNLYHPHCKVYGSFSDSESGLKMSCQLSESWVTTITIRINQVWQCLLQATLTFSPGLKLIEINS